MSHGQDDADLFRLALDAVPTGMLLTDRKGKMILVNAEMEQMFGYAREELLGKSVHLLVPPEYGDRHPELRETFFQDPKRRSMGKGRDLRGLRKDGTTVPVEVVLNPLITADGELVLASVTDLTERKLAARLRDQGRFFELSVDLVCILGPDRRFLQVNPAFTAIMGYSTEELLAVSVNDLIHPDDRDAAAEARRRMSPGSAVLDFTARYFCKDGTLRWLQWRAVADNDGLTYAIARDVTRKRAAEEARRLAVEELQRSEARLTASLKEREILLQEVHHRVKNNLQIISSLINLQGRQLPEGPAQEALAECSSRVETIALIHEKLYQSRDYARVPFSEYAKSLADNVFRASGISPAHVKLQTDVEAVALAVDRAIPCGLILNELITNALKHAFTGGRRGLVKVELRLLGDGQMLLGVSDDGVGMPPDFDSRSSPSLGMTLVTTLTSQLEGHLEIGGGPGTSFRLTFPLEASG